MNTLKPLLILVSLLISYCLFGQTDSPEEKLDVLKEKLNDEAANQWSEMSSSLVEVSKQAMAQRKNQFIIDNIKPILGVHKDSLRKHLNSFGDLNYFIGLAHTNLGEYIIALPFCERAESITERTSAADTLKRMVRKIILSHLYSSTEQINKAIKINEEGLNLATQLNNPAYIFRFLMNSGTAYQYKGEYDLSINYYNKALNEIKKVENNPYYKQAVYTNIGAAYLDSKRPNKAKQPLAEAYKIATSNTDPATGEIYDKLSSALLLNDLSKVNTRTDVQDSALFYAKEAVESIKNIYPNGHPYEGEFLLNLGIVFRKINKPTKAVQTLEESIKVSNKFLGPVNIHTATAYTNLADMKVEEASFEEAQKLYKKALSAIVSDYTETDQELPSIKSEAISPDIVIDILNNMATALIREHNADADIKLLKQAFEISIVASEFIEQFKSDLNDYKSRLLFASNFKAIYEQAITTAYKLYSIDQNEMYTSQALNWMEKNKGNELFIALNKALLKQTTQDTLLQQESNLKSQISYLENQLRGVKDSVRLANLKSRLFGLRKDLNMVKNNLKEQYPQLYSIKYGNQAIELTDIQKLLSNKTALTTYFVGVETTYYIKLSATEVTFSALGTSNDIKRLVRENNTALRNQSSTYAEISHDLYNVLGKSLQNDGANNLIIVPDGEMNYLPFEALVTEKDMSSYLINEFEISYLPSVNYMMLSRNIGKPELQDAIVFAPEFVGNSRLDEIVTRGGVPDQQLTKLPFAASEASQIATLYNTRPSIGEATETNLKNMVSNFDIIHLATHAIIDDENPNYSKLLLEKDDDNDGFLHTYEIYNMNINANLVSLSACNTGVGKYYDGEGVMSLARSFMHAGVPNVMTSLWSVPDKSTSEIMTSFYKHLKDGMSKAEALRQAKLDYLKTADKNTAAPYYWAGFVYIGSVEADKSSSNLWIGLVMAMIVTGIVLFVNKRRKTNARDR